MESLRPFRLELPLLILLLLVAGTVPHGELGTAHPALSTRGHDVHADTVDVKEAVRQFYDLYTARKWTALYRRAHDEIRKGGMTEANLRSFMSKKRDRLGPAMSIVVDVRGEGSGTGRVAAVARVTFENGMRVEHWELEVASDSVQWRSFRSSTPSASGSSAGKQRKVILEVGDQIPNFRVPALRDSSATHEPSDFTGKYLLLNFWATWCAPCIDKIPSQRDADRRFGDAFTILNVSFDRARSDVRSFLETTEMPGVHAFVGIRGLNSSIARTMGIHGLPHSVLVGPGGHVVATRQMIASEGLGSVLKREIEEQ